MIQPRTPRDPGSETRPRSSQRPAVRHAVRHAVRRLTAVAGLALAALLLGAAGEHEVEIVVLHTNDVHGHIGQAPALATVVRQLRAEHANSLLLDAGDCITGTPVSTAFQGRPVFDVLNLLGYDAGTIGNHEFDHGWPLLAEFRERAKHPLLCANAKDPDGKPFGDAPSQIFERGGVKIAVFGLVTDDVPSLTTRSASEGCTFESPIAVARRLVPELLKQADIVIAMTHYGIEEDAALAGAVDGIDLIVGGHTHTRLNKALQVGDTRIVQAWSYLRCLGVVELVWDKRKKAVTRFENRLVSINASEIEPAKDVLAEVRKWEDQVEEQVGRVIGHTDIRLDRNRLRTRIERIYKEVLQADFGYQNMGGLRANVAAGEIRIRDVWTVLPFDNTLVRIRLRGDQVPKWARKQLGKAFDPEREYVIATNSYVSDQRVKYFGAVDAVVEDSGLSMRQAVADWVEEHGGFERAKDGDKDDGRDPEPGEPR